jgi:alkyldihydroxyacetonephosphate synthase
MGDADVQRLRADLASLMGSEWVRWDEQTLLDHSHDTWPLSLLLAHQGRLSNRPGCVVQPGSTEDVAKLLRHAELVRAPVVPFGAGSGVCGGVLPTRESIVVDLRRMNQLVAVDETALTARVQAGMMGNHFEAALNARGYSMGHFPQSIDLSTVGGWVATRAAGQFSTRYGSIEDMLLGLVAVLPGGRVVSIKPVPRRSAGPDLRHLFLGSEGTLGIVTELTVRIFPLPESRRRLCFGFSDFGAGLEAIRRIVRVGWRPPVVRLYDALETERHFGRWAKPSQCFLILLTEGPATLTEVEAEACTAACAALGGESVGEEPVEHWLAERNHVPSLADLVSKGFVLDTIEVAASWDRIHALYEEVLRSVGEVQDLLLISGHSSHSYPQGTNIYFTFVARPANPDDGESIYRECWRRTMEATLQFDGTIAHHHGIGRLRSSWMTAEHGEGVAVLRAIKQALDPNGIMNPGVLLPPDDGG